MMQVEVMSVTPKRVVAITHMYSTEATTAANSIFYAPTAPPPRFVHDRTLARLPEPPIREALTREIACDRQADSSRRLSPEPSPFGFHTGQCCYIFFCRQQPPSVKRCFGPRYHHNFELKKP